MAFVFVGIFVLHDVVVGVFLDCCRDILGVLSTFEYSLRVFMFLNDMIFVFYIVDGFTENIRTSVYELLVYISGSVCSLW
jgi:hypothetical protein